VVLTMFDDRTNLAQQVMNELKNYFGEKLCTTTIPRNIRLAEAPSHGKAALVYDPRSRGAESYIKLAKEIIERQPAAFSHGPAVEPLAAVPASGEAPGAEEQGAAVEEVPVVAPEMDKTA
jgi:nitrogenase subunit NifH